MTVFVGPFMGGALIGFACLLMLLFNGRILGVSGIVGGIFEQSSESKHWRYFFLIGLIVGGFTIGSLIPDAFELSLQRSPLALVMAGLLVGYGTRLGSGCTSGHGVCGVSRLSLRSVVATFTFIACGALSVYVIQHFLGGRI